MIDAGSTLLMLICIPLTSPPLACGLFEPTSFWKRQFQQYAAVQRTSVPLGTLPNERIRSISQGTDRNFDALTMPAKPGTEKRTKRDSKRALAMSHPVRAQALRLLVERGKLSPRQIAERIGAQTSTVSYHCRQLVSYDCAELVEERRVEGKGAVEHFYIATERHLLDAEDWMRVGRYSGMATLHENAEKIFDDYEASVAAGVIGSDAEFHVTRTPMFLDQQGVKEAMENCERWRLEQSEIEARSAARRNESGESGIPASSSLAFFKMPKG